MPSGLRLAFYGLGAAISALWLADHVAQFLDPSRGPDPGVEGAFTLLVGAVITLVTRDVLRRKDRNGDDS